MNPKSDDPTTVMVLVERKTGVSRDYILKLIDSEGAEWDDAKKKLLDYGVRENDIIEIPPICLNVEDAEDPDAKYRIDDLNPFEDTLDNLKLKISDLTKIAPGKQRLHHKNQGQDLNNKDDNGRTMPDLNISHNDTIVVKAEPVVIQVKLPKGCRTRSQYLDPENEFLEDRDKKGKQEFSKGDNVQDFGDVDEDDPTATKQSGRTRNLYLDADGEPSNDQVGRDKRELSKGDNTKGLGGVDGDDDPTASRQGGRTRNLYLDADGEPSNDEVGKNKRELNKGGNLQDFGDADDDEGPSGEKPSGRSRNLYLDADGGSDSEKVGHDKRELNKGDNIKSFGGVDDDEGSSGEKPSGRSRTLYLDAESDPDIARTQGDKRELNQDDKRRFGGNHDDDIADEQRANYKSRNMYFDSDEPETLSIQIDPRKDTLDTFKKRVFDELGLPEDSKNLPITRIFAADMIGPDETPKKAKLDAPDGNTKLSELDILDDCTFELEPSTVKMKTNSGREFEFIIYPTDTVDDVNERVQRTLGIPFNKQRFTNIDGDDSDIDVGGNGGRTRFMDLEGVNDGETLLVTRKDVAITFKTPPDQEDLEVIIDPKIHNDAEKIRAFVFDSIGLPTEYQKKLKFNGEPLEKKNLDELGDCEVTLEPIQIQVKSSGGRPFYVEVLPTDNVEEVKKRLKIDIPLHQQVWTLEGDDDEAAILDDTKSKGRMFIMDFLEDGDTVNVEKGKVATKIKVPGRDEPIECYLDPKRDGLQRVREFIFDAYAVPEQDRERFSTKMPLRHKGQILEKNSLADLSEDDVIELVPDLTVNVNSGGRVFAVEYLPFDTLGKNFRLWHSCIV